jgi:hypothetical protein
MGLLKPSAPLKAGGLHRMASVPRPRAVVQSMAAWVRGRIPSDALSQRMLRRDTRFLRGTGGVSAEAKGAGFLPGFHDTETGRTYIACHADGRPAPMHLLEGLPEHLVTERNPSGKATAVCPSVVAGFIRNDVFYSREAAARLVQAGEPGGACRLLDKDYFACFAYLSLLVLLSPLLLLLLI